jgi:hypothetical protein
MAAERGKESQWRTERQRESLCQKTGYEFESSPAGRRLKERVVLRPYVRDEKEAHICENSK